MLRGPAARMMAAFDMGSARLLSKKEEVTIYDAILPRF
jgi:hypothetical protein